MHQAACQGPVPGRGPADARPARGGLQGDLGAAPSIRHQSGMITRTREYVQVATVPDASGMT
jgi:hypothetical protein